MLLEPDGAPAWRSEDVLSELPPELAEHTRGETHGLALELATNPHATVAGAADELRALRAGLADAVGGLGLRAAVAGTHPLVRAEEVEVSPGARYQYLHASLRELARREPTFALHVHVAVPDAELAVRALNGMRAHIPVLLALAANSPFTRGADSGLASARTPVFQAFPRTGIPRAMGSYADVRRGDRRADPLRRDPGADVHLVGRAAAAEVRHARGAGHGRADPHPRHGRAGGARAVPRAPGGARRAGRARALARGDRREPLPGRPRRDRGAAAGPAPRPLRPGLRAARDARRRLLAARPRARLRARAGDAGPPGRRPGRDAPARDRRRARPARAPAHAAARSSRRRVRSSPPQRDHNARVRACASRDPARRRLRRRRAPRRARARARSAASPSAARRPKLALPAGAHVYASEGPFGKTERFYAAVDGAPERSSPSATRPPTRSSPPATSCSRTDQEPPVEAEAHFEGGSACRSRRCATASCGCATRSHEPSPSRQRRTSTSTAQTPSARQPRNASSIIALA